MSSRCPLPVVAPFDLCGGLGEHGERSGGLITQEEKWRD